MNASNQTTENPPPIRKIKRLVSIRARDVANTAPKLLSPARNFRVNLRPDPNCTARVKLFPSQLSLSRSASSVPPPASASRWLFLRILIKRGSANCKRKKDGLFERGLRKCW
jgi:hypothetical protein